MLIVAAEKSNSHGSNNGKYTPEFRHGMHI